MQEAADCPADRINEDSGSASSLLKEKFARPRFIRANGFLLRNVEYFGCTNKLDASCKDHFR